MYYHIYKRVSRYLEGKHLEKSRGKIRELLMNLKKEFGGGANKMLKVTKLKNIKQESRTIEKFVQKLRREW